MLLVVHKRSWVHATDLTVFSRVHSLDNLVFVFFTAVRQISILLLRYFILDILHPDAIVVCMNGYSGIQSGNVCCSTQVSFVLL